MSTDFRALMAQMAAELDHNRRCLLDDASLTHPLADRARFLLAEPADGPAAVAGQPSDEELCELWWRMWETTDEGVVQFARAVLARWGNHFPDATKMVAPAEGEVVELVAELRSLAVPLAMHIPTVAARVTRAADLLQRQAAPVPVPVAIPGEQYHDDMGPVTWWRLPVEEPPWVGSPNDSDWPGYHTHFTPAPPEPALPLPAQAGEVQPDA